MNKKVLLIEDDPAVRENTAEILELANFLVQTANNGREGVTAAKSFIPDIIICDILMPELDGFGVLQILSKTPVLEHIPFIFLTAKTNHEDLRKGMELGADDYIKKPFEESELLRAIDSRLKRVEAFEVKKKFKFSTNNTKYKSLGNIKNIEHYLAKKQVYTYKKNETIYCQGIQSNHLYLIKNGLVKTYKSNELGKEFITSYYTNMQYFGYASFVKHTPHFENSKAIVNTQLYKISKEEITAVINDNNHILYNFIDLLASDLIDIKKQLITTAYSSVRRRTALTLIKLLDKYPTKNNNEISISRINLANSIGIAKESLIRTLHDFKEEKLIKVTTKSITIIDIPKLLKVN